MSRKRPTKAQQVRLDRLHRLRWKFIPGFDGLYRVSDTGRVQSCHRRGSRSQERAAWRDMKLQRHAHGYVVLGLGRRGKKRHYYLHRLVAEAFVPNPRGLKATNHIDCDKTNNRWTNLEWCTYAENTQHAMRMGLIISGSRHQHSKLTAGQVREIRARQAVGIRVPEIATAFEVCRQTVYHILNGDRYADVL